MYVCMYPCTSPLLPSISRKKNTVFPAFSQRGRPKTLSFFQIFGRRMQEAQASKKAGRGNRAWDRFAAPRRLRLVERHQIPPPPPPKKKNLRNRRRAGGGVRGTRRAMSADIIDFHLVVLKGFDFITGHISSFLPGGRSKGWAQCLFLWPDP